jgi:glycosyltransferase involved in cell wall biosynthesis
MQYALTDAQTRVIPNGIPTGNYSYRRANRAGAGPWEILFCGQLIPLKRCDVLLRAVAALPGNRVRVTLAYQNAQLEPELRALATELGLAEHVRFLGKLDPPALAALYQASDLLVLPSDSEALPSVITEAMLCGLPFVASDVGGVREQANGFGIVLEQRGVADFTAAIRRVLEHYPEYQAQGEAMSQYARARFSIPAMVERHVALYASLAGIEPRRHSRRLAALHGVARWTARRLGASGPKVIQDSHPQPEVSVSS